ncbi:hypothetical protein N0B44_16395 [Roseibacterium beibuensis]|uniref:hypothetical protein n=1 Tax=[Roseibacterium] beibuensis TaxID=1193142 RepID=UPI00217F0B01|nr:hypothetical protein [Roseibacterium beibuensis]MCS6624500.1 hypothetical protein [Roseibacterium beibuensis]
MMLTFPMILLWALSKIWPVLGSIGGVAAAAFAAWTAFETRRIALATKDTLASQQTWNQRSRRPVLTVEPAFEYFEMRWGPESSHGPEFWSHNRGSSPEVQTRPTLLLTNWGSGPAVGINVQVHFEDTDEPFTIPSQYRKVPGVGRPQAQISLQKGGFLVFRHAAGSSYLSAPRATSEQYFPACGAGAHRNVEIGRAVMHRIFARALEKAADPKRMIFSRSYLADLRVTVTFSSTEEAHLTEEYRFRMEASVTPDAINGSASQIWDEVEEPLKVFIELTPLAPPVAPKETIPD